MDKSKYFLDLIKLSEDQRKKIGILLRKHLEKIGFHTNVRLIEGIVFEDTFLYFNLSYKEWCLWHTKLENRTELTYPEFIKLFKGGESKEVLQVDIYSGELNTERISAYKKLSEHYNIQESTVRDIFNAGADWVINLKSNN